MKRFVEQLDSESLSALNYALNKPIQTISSGNFSIQIYNSIIEASTISINLSRNEYLIISNEWTDTPNDGIDYYFLEIRIADKPKDIKTKDDPKLKNSLLHYPNFSSLNLGAQSNLIELNIYEKFEKGNTEEVQYDSALLFRREDDLTFMIKNSSSIMPFLEIVSDKNEIRKMISELNVRTSLK